MLLKVASCVTEIILQERDISLFVSLVNSPEDTCGSIFTTSCHFDKLSSNQQTHSGDPKVSMDTRYSMCIKWYSRHVEYFHLSEWCSHKRQGVLRWKDFTQCKNHVASMLLSKKIILHIFLPTKKEYLRQSAPLDFMALGTCSLCPCSNQSTLLPHFQLQYFNVKEVWTAYWNIYHYHFNLDTNCGYYQDI